MAFLPPLKATIPPSTIAKSKRMSRFPVDNFSVSLISQPFGVNYVGGNFYTSLGTLAHNGTDIAVPTGTTVRCCFDGAIVSFVGFSDVGGNFVEIETLGFTIPGYDGSYQLRAYYGHLLKPLVARDQQVVDGMALGISDTTGNKVTGAHLHFGIYLFKRNGNAWEKVDQDNGYNGALDAEEFFPTTVEHFLYPVDNRYGLAVDTTSKAFGELYKKTITPWLRLKLHRAPTDRELNAFAYGRWSYEVVTDPARFIDWTTMTKGQWQEKFFKLIGR